jgi:protein-L-isoaspartate(D-aspartate) O-methyltransferase
MDFAAARANMVDRQIRTADVTDARLLAAFADIPREKFVPNDRRAVAYGDVDVPLEAASEPRALMSPAAFARLLQLAAVREQDLVLVVGAGAGYGAAVAARLAASVVAVEEDAALAARADATLAELGFSNVAVIRAPATGGCPAEAPFDVILVEGAVDRAPDALRSQLKDGGRLVAVIGRGRTARATLILRTGDEFGVREAFDVAVPPVPGFRDQPSFAFSE